MADGARLNDEQITARNEVGWGWGVGEGRGADDAAPVTGQTVARMDLTDLERADKRLYKKCIVVQDKT